VEIANYDSPSDPTEGYDVNNSGWVVGSGTDSYYYSSTAILWRDDGNGTRNLNDLIDPADPLKPYVVLSSAHAINDAGDILAVGYDSRDTNVRTYLLRGSSLALSPRALAFGDQKAGTTSAAKSITVQNNTSSAVPIANIALAGTGAGQFAFTHNCGSAVAAKGTCTIKVTFKPTTTGAKSATLSVNGGGGGLRVVNLTGTGI